MLRYLFVDFNSYFASVEQQLNPDLRGRPIAVVPMEVDTTFVIAASYEAKKFGVKTGVKVGDAKRMCPGLILVRGRHTEYINYHNQLVEAVESCIHVEQVMSIDEMYCELSRSQRSPEKAIELANHIKDTIYRTVGSELRCSIGIAPNVFLAKTATDMQKPDGLVILDKEDVPAKLFEKQMELRDLCGIGAKMFLRLQKNGIYTLRDLYDAKQERLRKVWGGIEGDRMYAKIRGEHIRSSETHKSVVGHSHVLSPDFRSHDGAYSVLQKLVQKAATRLRSYHYLAGALYIKVKYLGADSWVSMLSVQPTSDSRLFVNALSQMWEQNDHRNDKPFKVAVSLFNLVEEKGATLPLFSEFEENTELNKAMDKINSKYGRSSVYFAAAHGAVSQGAAPMRIAFHHIPDAQLEDDVKKTTRSRTKTEKPTMPEKKPFRL